MRNKSSNCNAFRASRYAYSGHWAVRFWLLNRQSLHQPAELLWGQIAYFSLASRPLEAAVLKPLIQENKAVALPKESLDTVTPASAEQKQAV